MHSRRLGVPIGLFLLIILPCVLLAMLKAMAGDWGGKQPYRVWTDHTGQFSAKARLITDKGNAVILERSDGRIVTVSLRKLSKVDQNHLMGDSMNGELFRLSFWKWKFSDPRDLWAILVTITPLWVSLVIPLCVAGFGLFLHKSTV